MQASVLHLGVQSKEDVARISLYRFVLRRHTFIHGLSLARHPHHELWTAV
ncbi:hypothetical protein BRADO4253 [Bradyrhizobium sp. ORS 278]|nr:hypothetical protein BRADO4253 [Bradyrhizobium sp. ORS 278]